MAREGLRRTLDAPTAGFLEGGVSLTSATGPQAWLEAGQRLAPGVGVFGRAFVNREDTGVLGGVRVEW